MIKETKTGFGCAPLKVEGEPYDMWRTPNNRFKPEKQTEEEQKQIRARLNSFIKESSAPTNVLSSQEFLRKVDTILNGITANDGYFVDTHEASDAMMEELLIAMGYGEAINVIRSFDRLYA